MKIIFVDTYYPAFLRSVRSKNKALDRRKYVYQRDFLLSQCFGTSDFFSSNFRKFGWKAEDIIINDEILQRKWAEENDLELKNSGLFSKVQNLPYLYKFFGRPGWIQLVTLAQIRKFKPDVVYVQDLSILDPKTLVEIKKDHPLLVGQIASPLPSRENLRCFDLIITSFPHFVKIFRKMGIRSEYHKLAFEPKILNKVGKQKRVYNVTFVGGFTPDHAKATKVLEEAAKKIRIDVWGRGIEFLAPTSPLRRHYHGEAWGLSMYRILARSKITLNRHISVSQGYANNMRLFESTGMGALLITDRKRNLGELFKVGQEALEYKDSEDLVSKVKYYLSHDEKRVQIAKRGQKRTVSDHAYPKRVKELISILEKYISKNHGKQF